MRVAVYWAPPAADPLWHLGCTWLGRDAETGTPCPQPEVPAIAEATAEPRHYGFHATLRAPMRLATGWDAFRDAVAALARDSRPFVLPPLMLDQPGGFLALRESAPCPPLQALAERCVALTDSHRLPPSPAELARRRASGLSARQEHLLLRWGYPYVMDEWFFHLTLTRRLSASETPPYREAAAAHFAAVLGAARQVEGLAIYTQSAADFVLAERIGFG